MSLEALESIEAVEPVAVEDEAKPTVEIYQSFAALELRFALLQDQLHDAAVKVNRLYDMGLTRTSGYTEAFAIYNSKLADFTELKVRLGLS